VAVDEFEPAVGQLVDEQVAGETDLFDKADLTQLNGVAMTEAANPIGIWQ
jgi:hypothetical protein